VLAIRPVTSTGTIRAYIDLQLGGITIMGARIVRQGEQRPWLGMPGIKTNHGWQNVVELSKPLREKVTEIVLAAWQGGCPESAGDQGREEWPGRAATAF
jgi:DNA-binding cell septation regulator SpoVG